MKTLLQWLRLHPIKAVLFTMIFTAIATSAAFREDQFVKLVCIYAFFLGLWCLVFTIDMRPKPDRVGIKLMALLLAGLFSYTPARAAEPPRKDAAAIGVGVVIICVGGFCVYKIVKVCQKVFPPKSTNAPPEDSFSASADEYGGACEYSSIGSCWMPPSLNLASFPYEDPFQNPTTFTLNVALQGGAVRTSMSANNDEGTAQTWDAFTAEMAGHGLFLTGRYSSQPQFEIGGVSCDPSMVPLEFDTQTGRITQKREGYALRRVSVERSPNLQDWYPMMVTDVSDGTGFRVIDTTREGQMFYRVSLQ